MTLEHPAFSVTVEELDVIFRVAEIREYAAGETVFSLGDEDRRMFYIAHGKVELTFAGGATPKTLSTGHFFGELAFIMSRTRRTATAQASTDCKLVCLDQSNYGVLMRENPSVFCTLLRNTCEYLLVSEQNLIASLNQKNRELENALHYLSKTREELDGKHLLAHTDELTGLFNRRGLNVFIDQSVERARACQDALGLIMLDLDNFKQVNDTRGHQQGDEMLRKVAGVLRNQARSTDAVCRRGGDEFVILLPGVTLDRGREVAEGIRRRIAEDCWMDGATGIKVTASLGLTFFAMDDSAGDLLLRADRNLYRAKALGRNRVVDDHA